MMPTVPMVSEVPKIFRVPKVAMVSKMPVRIMVFMVSMVLIEHPGACKASSTHGA